jgi:hypothetical protein
MFPFLYVIEMETYRRGTDGEEFYQVNAVPSNWWRYFQSDYKPDDDGWTQVSSAGMHAAKYAL